MNIGQAGTASGVDARLIRHYESIGLLPRVSRSEAGYRIYSENDVHILRFIKRARTLGFPLQEIKKLVSLWRNKSRSSAQVKDLTQSHIASLEKKIAELQSMASALRHLAKNCHGDSRPDCPILDNLESNT
ncbi:MAG: Cu(I)-responsive transcriptional regulator [Leptospirales bacterium]|nr:Cu(I)-responsive transcriptional regulator [Leptospirales bacterium]